jgi:hypothetical protein
MNQFVVAEGSSAYLSPAQQARVEMFADGMDRESAGGVEWKDLQHWQMGTELVSACELPAESFILVPNESPAEGVRIEFLFVPNLLVGAKGDECHCGVQCSCSAVRGRLFV